MRILPLVFSALLFLGAGSAIAADNSTGPSIGGLGYECFPGETEGGSGFCVCTSSRDCADMASDGVCATNPPGAERNPAFFDIIRDHLDCSNPSLGCTCKGVAQRSGSGKIDRRPRNVTSGSELAPVVQDSIFPDRQIAPAEGAVAPAQENAPSFRLKLSPATIAPNN
jgi:hypothetical protein